MRLVLAVTLSLACAACGEAASESDECPEGWCWERGAPIEVGGPVASRVYAIGPRGMFYVWQGDGFTPHHVPTARWIVSATVLEEGALWAADEVGDVWTSDDRESWRRVPHEAPIRRLWGTADGAVYGLAGASGGAHGSSSGGDLLRWMGEGWDVAAPRPPACVGTSYLPRSATEIWAADTDCEAEGSPVVVRRWAGEAWEPVGEPLPGGWFPRLTDWGDTVRMDVLALYEWIDGAWREVDWVDDRDAYSIASGERWLMRPGRVSFERDGALVDVIDRQPVGRRPASEWGEVPAVTWMGGDVVDASGLAPDDVWCVLADGAAAHYDGERLASIEGVDAQVFSVVGTNGVGWFGGRDALFRVQDARVERVPWPEGTEDARHLTVIESGVLVALDRQFGRESVYRYDGAWSAVYEPASDLPYLYDFAPASPDGRALFVSVYQHLRAGPGEVRRVDPSGELTVIPWPLSSFGAPTRIQQLVMAEGELYGAGDAIHQLTGDMEPIAANREMRLHVGPTRFWLYTATEAVSHPRPGP